MFYKLGNLSKSKELLRAYNESKENQPIVAEVAREVRVGGVDPGMMLESLGSELLLLSASLVLPF